MRPALYSNDEFCLRTIQEKVLKTQSTKTPLVGLYTGSSMFPDNT